MILLAMDQAPRFIGWAYGSPGEVPKRGVRANGSYGNNEVLLGIEVYNWALNFIKSVGADRLYLEQIIQRQSGFHSHTFDTQAMVRSAIQLAAVHAGIAPEDGIFEIMVADWRREFYGGRRPPKNADSQSDAWKMMAKVECADRGWLVEDHNAAEACGIWFYSCLHTDRRFRANHKITKRRAELKAMQEAEA